MLSPGTTGAITELKVAAFLMDKGFEVFRNLSPHGTADLIIRDRTSGVCKAIEVRTGSLGVNGKFYFPKKGIADNSDYYAVYFRENDTTAFFKISDYPLVSISVERLLL